MKIIVLKILSIACITFLVIVTFSLGYFTLMEGKHIFDPYIDTEFAEYYSPEKFEKIKVGMTIDEAYTIIGEPLYKEQGYIDTLNTCYHYTGDGKLSRVTKDNGQNDYDDFAWYRSILKVDDTNKIIDINKGWNYD